MDRDDDKQWRGVHISALQTSLNRYQFPELIRGQDEHTILVKLPVVIGQVPESYPSFLNSRDCWDQTHVRLPCSEKNVTRNHRRRWDIVRTEFVQISSSHQLERAILSYNNRYSETWNFSALHSFFEEALEEEETLLFFGTLFPKIVDLALCLPELITDGIPLLRRGYKHSVSLSQVQIASLLANAFLCTFPFRNWVGTKSEYSDYPDINFNRLFQCEDSSRVKSVHEKLKCILNYFRRVTASAPIGIVTYSRQFIPENLFPNWLESGNKLPKLYVSSSGTIEDDGFGLFQVDFANKFVGGGVIGTGCVQEEIRFVACPELILSRLFTQVLGKNEALVVTGCERFNRYKGYGHTFEWEGDYVDETPLDKYGRKHCTVIALNALCYQSNPNAQYLIRNVARDLNKAYVGFSWGNRRKQEELCAIATGNWGCGIFAGDPQLKSIIQLLAAGQVGRDLAYFTFGDPQLRDSMADTHKFLTQNSITVGKICHLLQSYSEQKMYDKIDLFEFLKIKILNGEESVPNTECYSKCFSEKTLKTCSSPESAMNENRSSFCRMKINETPNGTEEMDESDCNFKASERLKELPEPSPRPEVDANEERLKQDELRTISKFYEKACVTPQRDDFEVLDQFKQKMKNSFTKKLSLEEPEVEMIDRLQSLETNISTRLNIDKEEDCSANLNCECEVDEMSEARNNEKNDFEEEILKESRKELNRETTIKDVAEDEIANTKEPTVSSPIIASSTLGPLSQLSARMSKKSVTSRNKGSKGQFSQKRKLPDFFNSSISNSKKNA